MQRHLQRQMCETPAHNYICCESQSRNKEREICNATGNKLKKVLCVHCTYCIREKINVHKPAWKLHKVKGNAKYISSKKTNSASYTISVYVYLNSLTCLKLAWLWYFNFFWWIPETETCCNITVFTVILDQSCHPCWIKVYIYLYSIQYYTTGIFMSVS